ncbi:YjbF family lipoprotein [Luteimonas abyssi]|uniref:YjbF family lipoprotein n=1 Tax=Luteimonas abyssi TaxID=1247514 RepID=UPI000737B3CE|nr:YjbF family lipoprotein [Luteimonas abyssi]
MTSPLASSPAHCRRGHGRLRALSRWAAVSALPWLLAGCGSLGITAIQTVRQAVVGDASPPPPTADAVARSPHAQILVDGRLLLLGNVDDGGLESWFSADGRIVYLRDGLLAGSYGLSTDAAGIRIEGDDPFARLAALHAPVEVARRYDWRSGYRYDVPVHGELRPLGPARVTILDSEREVLHFQERLRGPGVDAVNEYWADPHDGFVLKSRQMLAPGRMLEIVQLKPYRAEAGE